MDEARDDIYCHLTARRSIATAALRLGLQRMSEEALDSMAGVLISYLERIGETLAASVEASGRSSAHCHVWDALRAIEQCTEPAVWRMHLTDEQSNGAVTGSAAGNTTSVPNGDAGDSTVGENGAKKDGDETTKMDPAEVLSWKGLASFCFGPKWSEPITEDELASMNMMMMNGAAAAATTDAPGKVGPSSIMMMDSSDRIGGPGWHAPFPDEVPLFPITHQNHTANPVNPQLQSTADSLHPTPSSLSQSLQQQLPPGNGDTDGDDLVDAIFQKSIWGQAQKPKDAANFGDKRKRDANGDVIMEDAKSTEKEPPNKKKKVDKNTSSKVAMEEEPTTDTDELEEDDTHPSYVPHFFPPFPRPTDLVGPIVADDDDSRGDTSYPRARNDTKEASQKAGSSAKSATSSPDEDEVYESSLQVRSALVKLGRPWGAISEDRSAVDTGVQRFVVTGGKASDGAAGGSGAPIVPLNKPSGSRPCKIMEGSMDNFA